MEKGDGKKTTLRVTTLRHRAGLLSSRRRCRFSSFQTHPAPAGHPSQEGNGPRPNQDIPLLGGVARAASRGGFNPAGKNLTALPS